MLIFNAYFLTFLIVFLSLFPITYKILSQVFDSILIILKSSIGRALIIDYSALSSVLHLSHDLIKNDSLQILRRHMLQQRDLRRGRVIRPAVTSTFSPNQAPIAPRAPFYSYLLLLNHTKFFRPTVWSVCRILHFRGKMIRRSI